jgi:hypothetical protein
MVFAVIRNPDCIPAGRRAVTRGRFALARRRRLD